MANWVNNTANESNISSIIVYSSPMAQYVLGPGFAGYRRIMDFVDVDSDKWRQYAAGKHWPMSWIYSREADQLLGFEREVARAFDASIFVTSDEVELFNSLSPDTTEKHHAVPNGVAADFFNPEKHFESPFSETALPIVFTGVMDYWANVDAVTWFAEDIFPRIRSAMGAAEFWVVGASPMPSVVALGSLEGVHVTGRVEDVRPYLAHAKLAVAPLRIARGIQNKVLEALAMGCPVLCTENAASGLEALSRAPVEVHDDPRKIEEAAIRTLKADPSRSVSEQARQYVLENYCWDRNLDQFDRIHAQGRQS
jgi:sugar transferase (PEP-CTERM/EpsH1 system associated)